MIGRHSQCMVSKAGKLLRDTRVFRDVQIDILYLINRYYIYFILKIVRRITII